MASTEAKANGFDEALLLDTEGFLAEGPGANLFFQKNNKLYTPKTGNILQGITRRTVLDLCAEFNIEVVEGNFTVADLQSADGAFMCGTAAEIIGLKSIEHQPFAKEWKETFGKKLQNSYKNLVLEQQYISL
jgi:branched-chain amino acid aminotransferase